MSVPTSHEFSNINYASISRITRDDILKTLTFTVVIDSHHKFNVRFNAFTVLRKRAEVSIDEFWDSVPPSKYRNVAFDLRNCFLLRVAGFDLRFADTRGHLHGAAEVEIEMDGISFQLKAAFAEVMNWF